MGTSAITALREIILEVVRQTAQGEWKLFIVDERSRKLVDCVVKEDDILQENVTNMEQIEHKRSMNQGLDAVYLLSPEPHIVDCLLHDLDNRRYRRSFVVWTSSLPNQLQTRIDDSASARESIAQARVLNVDFFPRESHLITFRDPSSFPILFHPACNQLVRQHMSDLSQKIVSICVSLGEYPTIRFYRPLNPLHEASVLCSHLARFVQDALDQYAKYHDDFPPPSPRPRGTLLITDRTMDLFAPLIHEFTYQAMVHDLLSLSEGERIFYETILNQGSPNEERKKMELGEKDKIWVENRHMHMKDLLEKLVGDFNKFRADHPQFAENSDNPSSLNNIKDMIAGLPQFQEGKELYSLHLNMAQECMTIFQKSHLIDVASVEQCMATGQDDDYKKPKNVTDQLIRLLDEDAVVPSDRLRLIIEYILYRDGIFGTDIEKLLAHAQLPAYERETIQNMDLLGSRVQRQVKDTKPPFQPLFQKKAVRPPGGNEFTLSRFEPAIKMMLEELLQGTLNQNVFPHTRPLLEGSDSLMGQVNVSQSSLRSAKPTWARSRPSAMEPRQRIIVFMAGGATYSEARSCYEISKSFSKDVYLATSHMITPSIFLGQVNSLGVDRRQLDLPADRPKPQTPKHVFERAAAPLRPLPPSIAPSESTTPGASGSNGPSSNGSARPQGPRSHPIPSPPFTGVSTSSKLQRDPEKKKKGFFKF